MIKTAARVLLKALAASLVCLVLLYGALVDKAAIRDAADQHAVILARFDEVRESRVFDDPSVPDPLARLADHARI